MNEAAEAEAAEPPAPEAPAPPAAEAPELTLSPYDLPGGRRVLSTGLQLAASASRDLRRASLYVGLLSLGLIGPTLLYGLALLTHRDFADLDLAAALGPGSPVAGHLVVMTLLACGAGLGWLAVTIDGQLIAVSLLAAHAGAQPFTLREATTRARQVFWRVVRGSAIVGVLNVIVQLIVQIALGDPSGSGDASTVIAAIVSVIVLAPFGYLATGIVLGDVGAIEALKRSVRLTRARPTVAIVVALFTLLTSAIQVFAVSAGLEVLVGVGNFFHLGVSTGGIALVATVAGLMAFVVALGSLVVTVAAIVAAPQVAAFLGLTFYSGGLDRARAVEPGGRPFRWVTRPMAALMLILALGSLVGIANLG